MMAEMLAAALVLSASGRCPDSFHLRWEAQHFGLPPRRVEAIARTESDCNLNPHLRGHYCGAHDCEVGRFQIKPSTARARCGAFNVWTYRGNVACALLMLRQDAQRFGMTDATMRHNGSGAIALEYLRRVLKNEERLP